ncbi:glucosamine-6-phosphate deaminase [Sporosarcina sp. ANT_H38]|uniref:glucosamine-6-phosphate deaminase n=1 Tax=Sporosarcina sp. ANT_H38 TaxID=2597358 RepID=UPI0011F1B014|nr:glucosamine-6-phosphate deaminase [Sporosarcina sp. ANT_H38]KAA0965317.1 glucosamine-6-phosphate deaminase [Sporosarcina sp. ANT_H38]
MKVVVFDNYEEVSVQVAQLVEAQILRNDRSVLGLATGSTPLGLYERLIEGVTSRGISYQNVRTINLDEYLGLGEGHPESYRTFMTDNLFNKIDIVTENTYIPDGTPDSAEEECLRYEQVIDDVGPIDLQILGIGTNGHIGFNEPGTDSNSLTHVVELVASTRESNARFFPSINEVPTHAITTGIKSILKSKQIIVMATGKDKAEAVKTLLSKDMNESFPASILWNHDNVTLIVDRDAYQLVKS